MSNLRGKTVGFGLTGSHCTLEETMPQIQRLVDAGARVVPIASQTVMTTDTRFGTTNHWQNQLKQITGEEIITTITDAEPLGPSKLFDVMVIAPCTGNTTSRLANALTDSPVLMAAKATLRNLYPVVLAISTNDGLGLNAPNIAKLLATKNIYFVPFGQVARMDLIMETCELAIQHRQLQPLLIERFHY